MKQKNLWLLAGCPGSGKSYWVARQPNATVVSRDAIRFSLLKDGDEYFSKEKEVKKEFLRQIQEALENGDENIYVEKVTFNGKELTDVYITHAELMKGGELVFTMSNEGK